MIQASHWKKLRSSSHLRDVPDHVERHLREVVVLPAQDLIEARDGLLQVDQLASMAGEDLGDLEGKVKMSHRDGNN